MIVFLTLYLGLVTGKQPLALQVDPEVKLIRIVVDGRIAAGLDGPPWRAEIDFGPALLPHDIVAVGLDAKGNEIARATQFVNVPRPPAEIEIAVDRDAEGRPVRAKLVVRHIAQKEARTAMLKLDDAALALDKDYVAALPAVEMKRPHLLSAEIRFADGAAARRELVFGGQFVESAEAQLTPVAVVATRKDPAGDCFVANGTTLHVRSLEEGDAQLIIVRDNTAGISRQYGPGKIRIGRGTVAQLFSPVPREVRAGDDMTQLFASSPLYDMAYTDLMQLLLHMQDPSMGGAARQYADAVAVAAVQAASRGRPRAVLLFLGWRRDASDHSPEVVRNYLAVLGVPLFVWAPYGLPSDAPLAGWGNVDDASSTRRVAVAAERIQQALAQQRIAWIEADPVTALRAEVKEGCGYARLAR